MSKAEIINKPPKEEFQKRGNFEWIILYILQNNPHKHILWKTFRNAGIKQSTLSNKLSILQARKYIKKIKSDEIEGRSTFYYEITPKGRDRFYKLSKFQEDNEVIINCDVPEIIKNEGKHRDIILWMLSNNNSCKWNDFLNVGINQSTLSKNLKILIEEEFVKKDKNKEYFITDKGKIKYKEILKIFSLDQQSILDEAKNRIEEITVKVNKFFQKYEIKIKEIKYRFLTKILKMDYSEINDTLKNEEYFYKILLFLSINHPDDYPEFISLKEFSERYDINQRILEYYHYAIVEDNNEKLFPSTKFFLLNIDQDKEYLLQEEEKLEKIIRVIVEDVIFKSNFLHKLDSDSYTLNNQTIIEEIIEELVKKNCFSEKFKDSLRSFLPQYIKYLKFKQKKEISIKEKETSDLSKKFEKIIWQSVSEKYFLEPFDIYVNTEKESILYNQKLDLLRLKIFKSNYFRKNLEIVELIEKKLYSREYKKAKEIFEDNIDQFKDLGTLILRDITNHYLRNYEESINASNELIEKYTNDYIGYLLQGNTYYKKEDYNNGLKILEEGLKINPHHIFLTYQYVLILNKMENYEESLDLINEFLEKKPRNTLFLIAKANVLELQEKYEEALKIYDISLKINENNIDLLVGKARCLESMKEYQLSLNYLERALKLNPDFREKSWIFTNQAAIYRFLHKFEDSLDYINKAIDLDPYYSNRYLGKAITLREMGRHKDALNELDIAIKLNPTDYYLYYEKSQILKVNLYDFQGALREIDKGLIQIPDKTLLLTDKAHNLLLLNKFDEALKIINKSTEIKSQSPYSLSVKSMILFQIGNYNEAFSLIDKVIGLNPKSCIGYNIKSKFLEKIKQYQEALNYINNVIEIHPENTKHKLDKIEILNKMMKFDEALNISDDLIKKEPENSIIYALRAFTLSGQGENKKSLELINKAIELDPKNPTHLKNKISILTRLKMYDVAFDEIKNVDSKDPDFYLLDAQIHRDLKEFDKAIEQLDKAIQFDNKDIKIYFLKAGILTKLKDFKGAIDLYDKILEINSKDHHAHFYKGQLYLKMTDYEEALKEIDNAIFFNPENYFYYGTKSAILCDNLNRLEEALDTVNEGLKIEADAEGLLHNKFIILFKLTYKSNKHKEVLKELDNFIKDNPKFSRFYGLKSKILFDLGKEDKAINLIEKAIELNPKEITNYRFQYEILVKLDNHEEVLDALNKALKEIPNDPSLLNLKIYTLARLNRKEEALATAEKLIKIDIREGNYYDSFGEILMKFNDFEEAIRKFEKAINLAPDGFFIHETYIKMGKCYLRLGKYDEALENLEIGKKLAKERTSEELVEKANKYILEIKEKMKN